MITSDVISINLRWYFLSFPLQAVPLVLFLGIPSYSGDAV
jgi:hypothetical protein